MKKHETYKAGIGMSNVGLRRIVGNLVRQGKLQAHLIENLGDKYKMVRADNIWEGQDYILQGVSDEKYFMAVHSAGNLNGTDKGFPIKSTFELLRLHPDFMADCENPNLHNLISRRIEEEYYSARLRIEAEDTWFPAGNEHLTARRGKTTLEGPHDATDVLVGHILGAVKRANEAPVRNTL